ncbi:MAG: hypothetical protein ACJA1B_003099 [Polaribacter sp.]|jgi:hypothetical protein
MKTEPMKKLLILLFILQSTYSFTCTCVHSDFGVKDYTNASYIVKGKVLKVRIDEENYKKIITFKVKKSHKGKVDKIIEIETALNSAACGVNIKEKDKWLLFVNQYNGQKSISLCDKNLRYSRRPNQDRQSRKKACKSMKTYIKKIKTFKNGGQSYA